MLKKETLNTLWSVIEPLEKCGVIAEEEVEEIRRLLLTPANAEENITETNPLADLQMFSLQRTARFLDRTVKGVYDLVESGDLEMIKLGYRTSRITCESIRRFVESRRQKPGNIKNEEKKQAEFDISKNKV
ncbi:MAG: helix-turn-helix domain-containing protein [Lentisphaeria bacterium]|jgi:hypothetical protein|nr:helix-turn-helix domain-containing protein [Lentisphaeria bacterium]